jgi:hypothetical protein
MLMPHVNIKHRKNNGNPKQNDITTLNHHTTFPDEGTSPTTEALAKCRHCVLKGSFVND